MTREQDSKGRPKRLTFRDNGYTNNCVIRLDGKEWIFGDRSYRFEDGTYAEKRPGRWQPQEEKISRKEEKGSRTIAGVKSVWEYEGEQVQITQLVEVVAGPQTGLLDTCLIRYQIHNLHKTQEHKIGLRFMLDTFIGTNDGVPFLIPGETKLCTTSKPFDDETKIPDFIQAREKENLRDPGTIAQIGLKLPGLEPPARVTLGAYPNPRLINRLNDRRCLQEQTLWEVPVHPIKTLDEGDSCVTIYWKEQTLAPGATREVGFMYGLGSIDSESGGALGLTTGGDFRPGGEFTVTAYVNQPVKDQKATLKLPPNFQLVSGSLTQDVPLPASDAEATSPVTWRVKSGQPTGTFPVEGRPSTGPAKKKPARTPAA